MLGEHNHEILVGELGLTDSDLTRLYNAQVIGTAPAGS
jgi:hypothetical protein